jgi:hypothetical protein
MHPPLYGKLLEILNKQELARLRYVQKPNAFEIGPDEADVLIMPLYQLEMIR